MKPPPSSSAALGRTSTRRWSKPSCACSTAPAPWPPSPPPPERLPSARTSSRRCHPRYNHPMPRDPQVPQFFRTLRVRNVNQVGVLASVLTAIFNTTAIVSDGSAVLGLGNLGALASMPVLEGKAALLAHLVGVNGVPIALRSQQPDDIVAAVEAIACNFGVIQLEDIASPK